MTDEQPLGFPALPIGETTYIDTLDVGTIKAGVIGSGQMKGKEIIISHEGVIQSESFSPGSLGWSINADGSAEFNDVTVRGEIEATSGELASLSITGTLTVASGGVIQSSNFISGATGWQIASTSAELNNVTVRGTIVATSGSLSSLTINGTLTMGFGGLIRTASSGERVEISNNLLSDIQWFNSGGSSVGTIGVSGSSLVITAGGGISLATSGNMNLSGNILSVGLTLQMGSGRQVQATNGNASVPGFSFQSGGTSSGMYFTGAALAWSTGGTGRILVGSGFFGPVSDGVLALGSGGNRWTEVWSIDGTINTSDDRMKRDVVNMGQLEGLDAIRSLTPKTYRWQHSPARLHRGFTAQDLIGGPFADAVWEGDGEMGVAYHEFIAPLVNAVQELAGRVEALEGA